MKHLIILIQIVIFFFSKSSGQFKVSVIDSNSKEVLPNATIFQFSKNHLAITKDQGSIELAFSRPDTIKVSYAGYIDKTIKIEGNEYYKVELVKSFEELPEILINPCNNWSKAHIYSPNSGSGELGDFVWRNIGNRGRVAMYVHSQEENSRLLGFMLNFRICPGGTKEAAKAPIQFSFYSVDSETMLPANLLTSKTILFSPNKIQKQWIYLDSLKLIIPKQGIYISMESYQDESYSYLIPIKSSNGKVDTMKWYGGALDAIYTKETWLSFYNFKTNKWFFSKGELIKQDLLNEAIKYEIKYSICEGK